MPWFSDKKLIEIKFLEPFKGGRKTILFLHGFGGGFESFAATSQHFHGRANVVLVKFNFEPEKAACIYDYAFEIMRFLNAQKISKINLVAHSFGARVAIILAAKTSYAERLVLTGPAGLRPRFSLKRWLQVRKYKFCKWLAALKLYKKESLKKFGSADYKSLNEAGRQSFVNIIKTDLRRLLPKIKVRTLIYQGTNDKATPPYMARIMARKISGSRLILKAGGHFCYLEHVNDFNLLVEKFILM